MDDEEVQRILARNIRALARENGVTLTRLADFIGTGKSQLFRVLRGETSPSLRWIVKVASYFGVRASDLLEPRRKQDRTDRPR